MPDTKIIEDGGPAFPHPTSPQLRGMSLRDWFAGQALAGHLASLNPGSWGRDAALASDAAEGAYLVADAMLAERAKPAGGAS